MNDAVVVFNAGSSSIRFALFAVEADSPRAVFRGHVDGLGSNPRLAAWDAGGGALAAQALPAQCDHAAALAAALDWLDGHDDAYRVRAAGHRVVHGGDRYAAPADVTGETLAALRALCPLAPLHQPHNLAAIEALANLRPGLPQVACFDTAFHQTQPALARLFALPAELTDAGIRRYGFHGLSYEYLARRLPAVLGERADGRVVAAHLGNGASLCAMLGRRSVATSMGFTALDGLMMGTRSGSIDPGVLLYLIEQRGLSSGELTRLLYQQSGLLGVSGLSQDMRVLLASDAPRAKLAIDLYVYRIVREVGSMSAALGGLDALVFTAGIGENAAPVRAAVCGALRWLGIELDEEANRAARPLIGRAGSRASVAIVPTDEEAMIAAHTLRRLRA